MLLWVVRAYKVGPDPGPVGRRPLELDPPGYNTGRRGVRGPGVGRGGRGVGENGVGRGGRGVGVRGPGPGPGTGPRPEPVPTRGTSSSNVDMSPNAAPSLTSTSPLPCRATTAPSPGQHGFSQQAHLLYALGSHATAQTSCSRRILVKLHRSNKYDFAIKER